MEWVNTESVVIGKCYFFAFTIIKPYLWKFTKLLLRCGTRPCERGTQ